MQAIQSFLNDHTWAYWLLILSGFFGLGWGLTRWLKDDRIWFILLATGLGLLFMLPPRDKLKLGIDLSGGTILVYQIDTTKTPASFGQTQMAQMVAALSKRINPAGTLDITIRPMGGDRLEIILPAGNAQDVQAVQDRITQMGQLEFRILANEKHDGEVGTHAIRQARELLAKDAETNLEVGRQHYQWVKIHDTDHFDEHGQTPGESVAVQDGYVLTIIPDETMRATGDHLTRVEPTQDRQFRPAVGFHFDTRGAQKFARLTRQYKPEGDEFRYRLAILLDNRVMSAPVINSPIEAGDGVIEGNFSQAEVDNLVAVLNAGKLPAMLIQTPISKDHVSATLGDDTIRQATYAILVAMVAVPVFMLAYYMFSGIVANIALVLNVILILGFMGFSQSTLTLPGLAGLALTIGMAVDANVLIFERMREERERGSALTQSVRNGFERAWRAILDSHVTTIFTSVVLYIVGTDQVKGFALTLLAGLVANLFTAVFMSRVIFEIWCRRGWMKDLKVMHLIKSPNIDWISPRYYFVGASIIVNVLAIVITIARGSTVLDIDFTGGAAVSVRLLPSVEAEKKERLVDYVRDQALTVLPNVKVERLKEENAGPDRGPLLLVRTTEANLTVTDPGSTSLRAGQVITPEELQQASRGIPEGGARPKTTLAAKAALTKQFRDELGILLTTKIVDWKKDPLPSDKEKPDSAEPSNSSSEKGSEQADDETPASRYRLTLNQPIAEQALTGKVDQALASMGISEPQLHRTVRAVTKPDAQELLTDTYVLQTKQDINVLIPKINERMEQDPIFERENSFGAQVAGETRNKAMVATVLSWVAIVVYLWFRFRKPSYGLAAVVSLIHDVLVALGFVAVGGWIAHAVPALSGLDFKIDLTVVSAFLTIIGYSVNDTIVVFDRLREIRGKTPVVTADIINAAVNQCMSRTILTSFTVILVCFIMFFFGGPGVHAFSFAMLIGAISGCYSTVFIAAPTLYFFEGPKQAAASAPGMRIEHATARA